MEIKKGVTKIILEKEDVETLDYACQIIEDFIEVVNNEDGVGVITNEGITYDCKEILQALTVIGVFSDAEFFEIL